MSGKAATRARPETHPRPGPYQPIVLRRHYERLTSAVEPLPRTARTNIELQVYPSCPPPTHAASAAHTTPLKPGTDTHAQIIMLVHTIAQTSLHYTHRDSSSTSNQNITVGSGSGRVFSVLTQDFQNIYAKNSCASCCFVIENFSWTLPMKDLNMVGLMGSWSTGSGVEDGRGDHRGWHWFHGLTSTLTRVGTPACETGNGCEGVITSLKGFGSRFCASESQNKIWGGYGELFGAGTGAGEKGSGMVCAEGWKSVSEIAESHEYDGPQDDSTRQEMTWFLVHHKPNISLSACTHNCPSPSPRQ
ncbi:hypothetical protein BU17DRAFT_60063 [Hysterangium stoloniferum]|nr:hypothetical protein BU17DRAFT_60063 [Hysterangium stoloniferum]